MKNFWTIHARVRVFRQHIHQLKGARHRSIRFKSDGTRLNGRWSCSRSSGAQRADARDKIVGSHTGHHGGRKLGQALQRIRGV